MIRTVLLAAVFVALTSGCNKEKEDAAPVSSPPAASTTNAQAAAPQQQAPPAAPIPLPPPPGTPVETTTIKEGDISQLTFELRRYVISHQRKPRDFQDFATASGLQIPPPPPGKKYAINLNTMRVVLENQ